ncbi:methyltransferase domain-containing protein [Pseudonocardia sp. DSM 110487]|uniref:methyltransferase domain-containing protein n=1 Tax=Pseudonocardia sp. DSM 110487 TaxID=2865833 RepID=UPI001C6A8607|nr:methyltransferase domain-containing protein [Pseudonocardia sp. DSM 110487]QYN34795.1 methyltransferase domain-containing protein [Pseudonocardia sp. DSM 110487]
MDKAFLEALIAFDRRPESVRLRRRTYELLQVEPGSRVVDVGCGGGTAVAELADLGADAVGIDAAAEAVAFARGQHPRCRFEVGDAQRLPFADGSLDGYRAEKLYHALADPDKACAEAHRVLAPGGRIVLVGQDWDVFAIDSDDPVVTRTIVTSSADEIANGRVARRYRNLLLDTGLDDVSCEVHTTVLTDPELALFTITRLADGAVRAGAVSEAQAETWLDEQRSRADRDRLFVAMPQFLVAGRRPVTPS